MTTQPSEKVLREIHLLLCGADSVSSINDCEQADALAKAILTWHTRQCEEMRKKDKETIDQLRVQLAGCGVAALGYASGENEVKPGDYGYSASYQDAKDLWDKYIKLTAELAKAKKELERVRGITIEVIESKLQTMRAISICYDCFAKREIAQAIHALINQKGEK